MNPMYLKILFSLIRQALKAGGLAGLAVSDNDLMQLASAVSVIVGFLWSLYKTFRDQQKLLVAAASPVPVSVDRVEAMVRAGLSPSVTTPKDTVPRQRSAVDHDPADD